MAIRPMGVNSRRVDTKIFLNDRRSVKAVQRHHHRVIIAGLVLQIPQRLGARTARLVDRNERTRTDRPFCSIRPCRQTCNLIRTATGARHDDKFDRLLGLPFGEWRPEPIQQVLPKR